MVGGRFGKQENLHMRLVLNGCKTSRSLHTPLRILKVCIEAFIGFSHVFSSDGLNILLSHGYVLETAPNVGMVGGTYIARTEEGVKSL